MDKKLINRAVTLAKRAGAADQPLTLTKIAERLKISKHTAGQVVKALQEKGILGKMVRGKGYVNKYAKEAPEPQKADKKPKAKATADHPEAARYEAELTLLSERTDRMVVDHREPKQKTGRKSDYEIKEIGSMLDSVRGWKQHGASNEEIAGMLGINVSTLYRWMADPKKKEFRDALRAGASVSNGEILNSAFRMSIGRAYKEQQVHKVKSYRTFRILDKDGKEYDVIKQVEELHIVEVDRYDPPNPNVLMFMLASRMPDDYRKINDKQDVKPDNPLDRMTQEQLDEELIKQRKILEAQQLREQIERGESNVGTREDTGERKPHERDTDET